MAEARRPVVLFACVHNAGRSVAAQLLARHHAGGAVEVRSAGSTPAGEVDPGVAAVLAERGLDASAHRPALLDTGTVAASDVVVTMGCGETCPYLPGRRYEDWPVPDPKGRPIGEVRAIVDEIDARVRDLLGDLGVPAS